MLLQNYVYIYALISKNKLKMCSIQSRELKRHGQSILPTAVFENIPHRTTKNICFHDSAHIYEVSSKCTRTNGET